MKRVVAAPVAIVITQPSSHLQSQLWCHRDVAGIEQPVEVRSQQQSITNLVWAFMRIRPDVGSFECRQRVLARHRTGPAIGVEDCNAKRCLTKPGSDEARIAIAGARLRRDRKRPDLGMRREYCRLGQAGVPDALPLANAEVVLDWGLDAGMPIGGLRDPCSTRKEGRRHELNAADLVGPRRGIVSNTPTDSCDASVHLFEGSASIAHLKGLPCQPIWKRRKLRKVRESADRVVRSTKLEEEGGKLGCSERAARRRSPEVQFRHVALLLEKGVPALVRYRDRP